MLGIAMREANVQMKNITKALFVMVGYVTIMSSALMSQERTNDSDRSHLGSQVVIGSKVRLFVGYTPEGNKKVRANTTRYIGTVANIGPDTITVLVGSIAKVFRFSSLSRFEIHDGTRPAVLQGAGLGLILGAGVGLIYGIASCSSETVNDSQNSFLRGLGGNSDCIRKSIIYGATLGLLVGAIEGLSAQKDKWKEVDIRRINLGIAPMQDNTLGLKLSLSF